MENGKEQIRERMNVATALNSRYTRYAAVMLTFLFVNNVDTEIHVYVLHRDLSQENRMQLQKLAEQWDQKLHFLIVDTGSFPEEFPVLSWSLEACFRLLLSDILPREVDRILYLDGDVIINKSIKEMYFTDFEDKLFVYAEMVLISHVKQKWIMKYLIK